jgi:hypothetical protein
MLALLVGLAVQQDGDPIARFADFVAKSDSFTLEYTVTDSRAKSKGNCKYEALKPNFEKFSVKWDTESFRYSHSPLGGISVRDDWKTYAESYTVPQIGYLPDTLTGVASLAYPMLLLPPTLREMYANSKVTDMGDETIAGKLCDKVSVAGTNGNSSTFWIAKDGRIWKWLRLAIDQAGTYTTTFEFSKFESGANKDKAYYSPKLPLGYVPHSIPGPRTRTIQTEEPAPLGSWYDLRKGAKNDAKSLPRPLAIVFTDPACPICAKIEPYLAALRRQLKAKGCTLVEVSLGTQKPDATKKDKDRPVFWDSDGAIERAFGTPGTPYFLVVDKEGTLVAGFQGYSKELEATITKSLLVPFEGG